MGLETHAGIDTTDFKNGIVEMQRQIRVLNSEFERSASALADWSKDATGLEQRMDTLTRKIEVQKRIVAATEEQYRKMAEVHGANSREAQEFEIKLNKETASLNKMQVELGQTDKSLKDLKSSSDHAGNEVQQLDTKSQGAEKSLDSLKKVSSGLAGALKVGVAGVVALAGAVAGLAMGIGKLVVDTANEADEHENRDQHGAVTRITVYWRSSGN